MRDVRYEFEELPIYAGAGAARRVVARVAGVAELVFDGEDLDEFEVSLTSEGGRTLPLDAKDPLYPQVRREILWRHDQWFFDTDRPLRGENDEHRLTTSMVL